MSNINFDEIIKIYLSDVRKYPLLSSKEEKELAIDYCDNNNTESREKLINHNLRLVLASTIRLKGWANQAADLIQEGNIGLIRAVDKFDPYRNVPLSSYAWRWIRAFQFKFIINNANLIKIGTTEAQRKIFFGINKLKTKLSK